ncbi:MAG TPA: hypothetical protein VF230_18110 [Acidimicrobiales bacterium]
MDGLDRLDALLADAAAAEAARDRARTRSLREAAEQEATFEGTLVDLAEAGADVSVRTVVGRVHRGRVTAVGRDFFVVQDGRRAPALVAFAGTASVRTAPGGTGREGAVTGRRRGAVAASFATVLAGLAAERPSVRIGVVGGEATIAGELRSVGTDVVAVRGDAGDRPTLVVPVVAVVDVVLLDDAG